MKIGFDQIRVIEKDEGDVSSAADTIIKAHKIRQLTATISRAYVGDDAYLAKQCVVVGKYGNCLGLGFIRGNDVCDAKVLPHRKDEIKRALKVCATQLPWKEDEIALLGDMHFYLSYFVEDWNPLAEGNEQELFTNQAAEGESLRSEWQTEMSRKQPSRISRMMKSWLKPNA